LEVCLIDLLICARIGNRIYQAVVSSKLFRKVVIVDGQKESSEPVDLLIENGIITAIGTSIAREESHEVIEIPGVRVSVGWLDMRCSLAELNENNTEDLPSLTNAAAIGGFTEICVLPVSGAANYTFYPQLGNPLTVKNSAPVTVHPIMEVTEAGDGKELAELIEHQEAGAVAFTHSGGLQRSEVLVKALAYLNQFNGLLIQRSVNEALCKGGQMHEGTVSTRLGLRGLPAMAEEVQLQRDLELLRATGGKLHISHLSTARSVELIRQAKQEGVAVTCDICAHQIAFTDGDIIAFDTHFKVDPPFRSEQDRMTLIAGLQDGTIDAIVSDHIPLDPESKDLEFDQAAFGIAGIETAYSVVNTYCPDLTVAEAVQLLAIRPRQILGFPIPEIAEGEKANLTFFMPGKNWTPQEKTCATKVRNNPFFGMELKGQVVGIYNQQKWLPNATFDKD
jgi:dihydroorotase